ncbi:flagellar basal body rod protein FlgF [Qipengyuania sp.]|uniref:flagellar basal body rod protein FlgF n=1 Tax=Qipengyuania sp. TaxID=2004515 RepID=UPI0035C7D7B5
MDRLIYTALSGLSASMDRQRVIASNMANAQTIGFRAELMDQRAVTIAGEQPEVRAQQQALVRSADMQGGEAVMTSRPLDIALDGSALLAVQADDGSEAYTRRGDLSVRADGVVVNGDGAMVIGEAGPITVPLTGRISVTPSGAVTVSDPATPDLPAIEVAQLKLASPDGSQIAKGVDGLFRVVGGGILPTDEAATLKPGYLEQSNVKPTEVLVEMIDQQRLFEMRTKLVTTAKTIDESGARLMRLI